MQQYKDWITQNIKSREDYWRKCSDVTLRMQKEFPELIRVRGHFNDMWFGPQPHWWLKTSYGLIVDPTFAQFSGSLPSELSGLPHEYEECDEENLPIGKCLHCGEYIYEGGAFRNFCDENCEIECRAFMGITN